MGGLGGGVYLIVSHTRVVSQTDLHSRPGFSGLSVSITVAKEGGRARDPSCSL